MDREHVGAELAGAAGDAAAGLVARGRHRRPAFQQRQQRRAAGPHGPRLLRVHRIPAAAAHLLGQIAVRATARPAPPPQALSRLGRRFLPPRWRQVSSFTEHFFCLNNQRPTIWTKKSNSLSLKLKFDLKNQHFAIILPMNWKSLT